jgi:hypothetical protein
MIRGNYGYSCDPVAVVYVVLLFHSNEWVSLEPGAVGLFPLGSYVPGTRSGSAILNRSDN